MKHTIAKTNAIIALIIIQIIFPFIGIVELVCYKYMKYLWKNRTNEGK